MKKQYIYSFAAMMSLALISCNGEYDDWAAPQSYEQETAAGAYEMSISKGSDAAIQMPVKSDSVKLVSFSANSEEVTGYSIRKVTINGNEVTTSVVGNDLIALASELEKMVQKDAFTRAQKTHDLKILLNMGANLANGDAVAFAGEITTTITTGQIPAEDENGYYLLGDFAENGNGWDTAAPVWMTDNGDGTYTATVNTKNEGDNWFKFYAGSYYVSGDWDSINQGQMGCAVNGDNASKNLVVWTGDESYPDGVQTAVISGQGTFEVTLDINNYTYTVKRAEAMYYVVGTANGWSDKDKSVMFYAHGDNVYSYTTSWTGAWDLKIWDAKGFGDWAKTFGGINGDGSPTGTLIPGGDGAFQSPTADYYTLTINMNDYSYAWELATPAAEYTAVSLIGDFNGWGGDIDLTQLEKAPHNWYVRAEIPTDGGLKFRANHDWATSWGTSDKETPIGDIYYLPIGGDNINVPAGTYDFYLNDITGRWNIVAVTE